MENSGKAIPVENLMDASIDDLNDLPAFTIPPQGHYKLTVSLERKTVNDKPTIEASCVVMETLELADKAQTPSENGTKFSQLFMMDNEWGQGGFKGFVTPIAQAMSIKQIGEAVDKIKNIQIAATVKHRVHKEDRNKPKEDQRVYANLQNVEVL